MARAAASADEPVLIDLLASQSVEEIEGLLDRLQASRAATPYVDLRIPAQLTSAWLGGVGAVMHLTAHWARTCREYGALRTRWASTVSSAKIEEDLEKYEHLLLAAAVAPKILAQARGADITEITRAAARTVLARRRDRGPRRRMRSLLEMVVDEWPDLAPRSLYARGDARYPLTLRDEYLPLADRVFELRQLASLSVDGATTSALSWTLLELFQNTDQWAKSLPSTAGDIDASPSSRLIHARWVTFDTADATSRVGDSPALLDFLARSLQPGETRHRLFEITVLDMGPGIAGWRSAERSQQGLNVEEEVSDLRWSLARRRTTSLDPTKGMGFHRAFLNLTTLNGFIQIRTGAVSAFRDFSVDSYPSEREASDAALPSASRENWTFIRNWVEQGGPRERPVGRQIGTRVTMIIPVKRGAHSDN